MSELTMQAEPDRARRYLKLTLVGLVIGIPAALVAAGFLALAHALEDLLWPEDPAWPLVIGLPAIGGLIVYVARRFLPGDGGHSPVEGTPHGVTPYAYVPSIALAALATLAFGLVLGPEGPLIALGSAVGMVAHRFAKIEERSEVVVGTAGSFAAVSALFGGPLVAGMFMLESGIAAGAALVPMLVPGLVAAASGYVIFTGLGNWSGIESEGLAVSGLPAYSGTHVLDLVLAVGVGVLAAVLIAVVQRYAAGLSRVVDVPRRRLVALVGGGALVGLIAVLADLLGSDSQDVLFSGQASIGTVTADSFGVVILVLVAKALAYLISLGVGFRGGPIFPAIFLGVGVAALFADVFDVSPTWAVAVGAAAGMAAGSGLLFSGLLLALMLVGSHGFDTTPAAVFAGTAAWLVRNAILGRIAARASAVA